MSWKYNNTQAPKDGGRGDLTENEKDAQREEDHSEYQTPDPQGPVVCRRILFQCPHGGETYGRTEKGSIYCRDASLQVLSVNGNELKMILEDLP